MSAAPSVAQLVVIGAGVTLLLLAAWILLAAVAALKMADAYEADEGTVV